MKINNKPKKDTWRGHLITKQGLDWVYVDTQQPVRLNPDRDYGCLGTLPGVTNACCGHGNPNDAYIQRAQLNKEETDAD
jgi:hypothetical protein